MLTNPMLLARLQQQMYQQRQPGVGPQPGMGNAQTGRYDYAQAQRAAAEELAYRQQHPGEPQLPAGGMFRDSGVGGGFAGQPWQFQPTPGAPQPPVGGTFRDSGVGGGFSGQPWQFPGSPGMPINPGSRGFPGTGGPPNARGGPYVPPQQQPPQYRGVIPEPWYRQQPPQQPGQRGPNFRSGGWMGKYHSKYRNRAWNPSQRTGGRGGMYAQMLMARKKYRQTQQPTTGARAASTPQLLADRGM